MSTHVLGSSRVSRAGRKAICRMTNERRATWVASAVAGNGEHRSVSPHALSCRSVFGIGLGCELNSNVSATDLQRSAGSERIRGNRGFISENNRVSPRKSPMICSRFGIRKQD